MTHFDHDDGLTDPASRWGTDETDRACDHWLDEKLGVNL